MTSGERKFVVRFKLTLIGVTALLFVGFCDPLLLWSLGQEQTQKRPDEINVLTWRPNKPVPQAKYVGGQTCANCHTEQAASYKGASMARALETVADCQVLREHPLLTFKLGPYNYKIARQGGESIYTVSDGQQSVSIPILHCFGQGKAGQTYVLKHKGSFYESRVSYYKAIDGLDITIGYLREMPKTLDDAVGRLTGPDEIINCYGCHSTGAVNGTQLQLDKLMPGVSCEACHGPGEKHVAAMNAGNLAQKNIFNPARLSPDVLTQEFCASCHRSAEEVALMPRQGDVNSVRFQPYRIFSSACYADDERISCTACHNPHGHLKQEVSFYDAKCLACHASSDKQKTAKLVSSAARELNASSSAQQRKPADAPPCPVETKNCTSCHMPKTDLPGAHIQFTDHRIRVVRPGEPYPK